MNYKFWLFNWKSLSFWEKFFGSYESFRLILLILNNGMILVNQKFVKKSFDVPEPT